MTVFVRMPLVISLFSTHWNKFKGQSRSRPSLENVAPCLLPTSSRRRGRVVQPRSELATRSPRRCFQGHAAGYVPVCYVPVCGSMVMTATCCPFTVGQQRADAPPHGPPPPPHPRHNRCEFSVLPSDNSRPPARPALRPSQGRSAARAGGLFQKQEPKIRTYCSSVWRNRVCGRVGRWEKRRDEERNC